jgi:hypothetical protein
MEAIDPRWRTSSYSDNGGECAEIGHSADRVMVRDSKDRTGPVLRISPDAWRAFANGLKNDASLSSNVSSANGRHQRCRPFACPDALRPTDDEICIGVARMTILVRLERATTAARTSARTAASVRTR